MMSLVALWLMIWINLGVYALLVHTNFFVGMRGLQRLTAVDHVVNWIALMWSLIRWPVILIHMSDDEDDDDDFDDFDEDDMGDTEDQKHAESN